MIRVFVIDGTDTGLYYKTLTKHIPDKDIDLETSMDRALARLGQKTYDLILVSRAEGKSDYLDVADMIRQSRVNKSAYVIMMEDNPTVASKFVGHLRGRRVYRFKSNQCGKLEELLERMSM